MHTPCAASQPRGRSSIAAVWTSSTSAPSASFPPARRNGSSLLAGRAHQEYEQAAEEHGSRRALHADARNEEQIERDVRRRGGE